MKNENNQMLYKVAATFGRFNIPHKGHVELIQQMLAHGEVAHVHVSTGAKNNSWNVRVMMLRHMCRYAGLDLDRVKFINSPNAQDALVESIVAAEFNEVVLVLGSDQMDMAYKFSDIYDVSVVINRRSGSSTGVRHFLDCTNFFEDAVNLYKGDEFAAALAIVLRHEETSNVKVGAA
jgi:cytidyltransferase-like protein